jgi:hypothetical protein
MEMRSSLWVQGMWQTNNFTSLHLGERDLPEKNGRSSIKERVYSRSNFHLTTAFPNCSEKYFSAKPFYEITTKL